MDPSPTAEATRLRLPSRTSPTANTPGKLGFKKMGNPMDLSKSYQPWQEFIILQRG